MTFFKPSECDCSCGCGAMPEQKLIDLMNEIRRDFGKPIRVTSMKRCLNHNREIGGAPRSRHVAGDACDMVYTEELRAFLEANLSKYKICLEDPEVTKKGRWLHIDMIYRNGWRVFKP